MKRYRTIKVFPLDQLKVNSRQLHIKYLTDHSPKRLLIVRYLVRVHYDMMGWDAMQYHTVQYDGIMNLRKELSI